MRSHKYLLRAATAMTIIMLLLTTGPVPSVLAESVGPNDAGSGTNVTGVGVAAWQSPGNIATPGSPYASVTLRKFFLVSNYLQGTDYGFNIPSDATINGIEVIISRQTSAHNPSIVDNVVSLVKGGVIVGENKASIELWPLTMGPITYGSTNDLWGATWTPEDINSVDFGVVLSAQRENNGNNDRDALVDYMQVTVSYTLYQTTTAVNCGGGAPVVTYGDSLTCVATVTRLSGTSTPTGTVSWTTDGAGSFDPNPCMLSGTDGISLCSATYTPTPVGSGTHLVTATYNGDELFSSSSGSQTVTVNSRPVTVTADAKTKVYGEADPLLTYQITSGSLVPGDVFAGALSRAPGEDVGAYAIQQSTLTLGANYNLTYVGADLTITPRFVTVTADAKTKVYGEADPLLTYQITSGSLVPGDVFTGALTRVAGEDVGAYAIQQGTLTLSDNYNLTYVGADLTITSRPVTVTVDAKTKVYGEADPLLTYQVTSESLVTDDVFTGALTRAPGEGVGAYAILQGTLTLGANYNLTYVGANLTITPRPITVTADTKTKLVGQPDPALTYHVTSGSLVFDDTFSGSLTRVAGENVGKYAILQGSLALTANYNLTYVGANLTITNQIIFLPIIIK